MDISSSSILHSRLAYLRSLINDDMNGVYKENIDKVIPIVTKVKIEKMKNIKIKEKENKKSENYDESLTLNTLEKMLQPFNLFKSRHTRPIAENSMFDLMRGMRKMPTRSPILLEGPIPLENIGNNCYMNSAIQCLLVPFIKLRNNTKITLPLQCSSFWLMNKFIEAQENRHTFSIPKFIKENSHLQYFGYQLSWNRQEDAHEFLNNVLDTLDEELKKHDSSYKSLFVSSYDTRYFCDLCGKSNSSTSQMVNDQVLFLNVKNNFKEMLEDSMKDKVDEYRCENCSSLRGSASRSCIFSGLSEYLVVCFKRFATDITTMTQRKVNAEIKIEETIMVPYMDNGIAKEALYELISIVNHHGGITGGHYYSFVKFGEIWYKTNDENVTEINIDKVKDDSERTNYIQVYKQV